MPIECQGWSVENIVDISTSSNGFGKPKATKETRKIEEEKFWSTQKDEK